jgi:hypothetical protein
MEKNVSHLNLAIAFVKQKKTSLLLHYSKKRFDAKKKTAGDVGANILYYCSIVAIFSDKVILSETSPKMLEQFFILI